jgi:predicted N-acetyltransferase YhbS
MTTSLVRTRPAGVDDVDAVRELHDRCSPAALERRFHVPTTRVSPRLAEQLVLPRRGWSLVAEQCGEVVGHACVAEVSRTQLEVGLIVEDAQQGCGIGSRLLRDLAREAAARGYSSLVCLAQADNDSVLRTVRRAGLAGEPSYDDDLLEIVVPLSTASAELSLPA